MKFTIVDNGTNDILRIENLDNRIIDAAVAAGEDVEAIKSDFIESLNLAVNETAYEGNFVATAYDFNGTEFVENVKFEYIPPVLRRPESLLMTLVEQMLECGFTLPLHKDLVRTKADAKNLIDQAASRACERFVSPGKFTVFEYQLTQQKVKDWRAASSPANNVPEMLQSWFDNSDFTTVEDAALNIEATATQFNTIIALTRRLRLQGKKAVDDETGDYKVVMESFINQLDNI